MSCATRWTGFRRLRPPGTAPTRTAAQLRCRRGLDACVARSIVELWGGVLAMESVPLGVQQCAAAVCSSRQRGVPRSRRHGPVTAPTAGGGAAAACALRGFMALCAAESGMCGPGMCANVGGSGLCAVDAAAPPTAVTPLLRKKPLFSAASPSPPSSAVRRGVSSAATALLW